MLAVDLKVIEEEHEGPLGVLQKTADGLPGFGIVAAVMGIVVTMGAIDGPVEEVGEKVGAALVGTFLGILLSYGFIAPLSVRLAFSGRVGIGFLPMHCHGYPGVCHGLRPEDCHRNGEAGHEFGCPHCSRRTGSVVRRSRRIVRKAPSCQANSTTAAHGKWPTRISSPR